MSVFFYCKVDFCVVCFRMVEFLVDFFLHGLFSRG